MHERPVSDLGQRFTLSSPVLAQAGKVFLAGK